MLLIDTFFMLCYLQCWLSVNNVHNGIDISILAFMILL